MTATLPVHEVRQRIRATAEAWVAYAPNVPDESPWQAWQLQVCFTVDGGEAALGMSLAQYGELVTAWCTVLRTTGAYPKDRAHAELLAWRASGHS